MTQHIKEWIENNHLDVQWTSDTTFCLDQKDYLCLDHKEGKIFDEEFNLILSEKEKDEILIHRYCFSFGGKVYWSPITAQRPQLNILKHIGRATGLSGFPYLGIHGGYELCSGSRSYEDWVKKAKWLGIDTLGICEKNTLAGVLKFQKACEKDGIKPIIGETVSVQGEFGNYLVKLYVVNEFGWQNLLRINKRLNIDNDGQYVEEEFLLKFSDNLICVFQHDTSVSEVRLHDHSFRHVFFQLDPVRYRSDKRDLHVLSCLKNAIDHGFKIILICDSYYLDQEDYRVKNILKFIGNSFFYESDDQWFKSLEDVDSQLTEMFETKGLEFSIEVLSNSLINLQLLINSCDFNIPVDKIRLPKYTLSTHEAQVFKSNEELFWQLIQDGLASKVRSNKQIYIDRVESEVDIIIRGGFIDYFLIIRDIINWCEENGILVGVGRGSIGGSIVAYLLGITKVDAIEYGLVFERFLNESRIGKGLPDIDTDFLSVRRDEVKKYVEDRFGATNICSIGTYSTFKTKSVFRDLLRFNSEQPQIINYFSAILEDSDLDLSNFLREVALSTKLKEFVSDRDFLINDLELLLGQPRSQSIHAAGILITPENNDQGEKVEIFDWIPCRKVNGNIVSEWEGPQLEQCGFLKADILGLSQLDKLDAILKLIKDNHHVELNLIELDKHDSSVFELFHLGLTQDVFQFTTDGLSAYCKEAKPDSILELATLSSLYRPGAMDSGAHSDYVKIKFGKKDPEYDWGCEEITKDTFGLLIFQEQGLKICQTIGGLTLTEADGVRKAIGKKDFDLMKKYQDRFLSGAIKNGCPVHEAHKIWQKIEAFAGYSFNLAHAVAYSWIGYQCQWLKRHYPLEFWTVSLQHADDKDLFKRISELRRFRDLSIKQPDINYSKDVFYTDINTKSIYWSLSKIKQVGQTTFELIEKERLTNGLFFSLEEFVKRLRGKRIGRQVVKNLIFAGCFDEIYKINNLKDRLLVFREFDDIFNDNMLDELSGIGEFSLYKAQRDVSGFGFFDYDKAIKKLGWNVDDHVEPADINNSSELIGELIVVSGLIIEANKRMTKKGEICKMIIDHNGEAFEVLIWNDVWEIFKNQLKDSVNKGIVMSGILTYNSFQKKNVVYSFNETNIELF